jgi:hypothetical protein
MVLKIIEKTADPTSLFITETEDLSNFIVRLAFSAIGWGKNIFAFALSLFYVINDEGARPVRSPNARIFMPHALQVN